MLPVGPTVETDTSLPPVFSESSEDILEWESGVWNQKTVEVAPSMVFDVEGG